MKLAGAMQSACIVLEGAAGKACNDAVAFIAEDEPLDIDIDGDATVAETFTGTAIGGTLLWQRLLVVLIIALIAWAIG